MTDKISAANVSFGMRTKSVYDIALYSGSHVALWVDLNRSLF